MAAVYRTFALNNITIPQSTAISKAWRTAGIVGLSAVAIKYNPSTQIFIIAMGVDTEDLPNGVTAASLRADIRSFFQNVLSRLPDSDIVDVKGTHCTTGRDARVGSR